jgi:hypothetical protein
MAGKGIPREKENRKNDNRRKSWQNRRLAVKNDNGEGRKNDNNG